MKQSKHYLFIILVAFLLIYLYFINIDRFGFVNQHNVIALLVFVLVLGGAIWIAHRLEHWLTKFKRSRWLKLILSFVIVLFLTYQFFTPYFYASDYLIKTGIAQIETYFSLGDHDLHEDEQKQLAHSALSESFAFRTISLNHIPQESLTDVLVIDLTRSFNRYELVTELTQKTQEGVEQNIYEFTFIREGRAFKLDGFTVLND